MHKALLIAGTAAFALASSGVPAASVGGDADAGKQKAEACAACHGADGNGTAPIYPRLAGQYADYLYMTLKRYKSGERSNAIMNGMAAPLSDEDMRDLASYYAQLPNGLGTPK